jgi:hypothetical protein
MSNNSFSKRFYDDDGNKHGESFITLPSGERIKMNSLRRDRELVYCQNSFRTLLESYGAEVELNLSGPTFICTLDESKFYLHPIYVHMDIDSPLSPAEDPIQEGLRNYPEIVTKLAEAVPECPIKNIPLLLAVCAYGPEDKYTIAPLRPYRLLLDTVNAKPEIKENLSGLLICGHTYRGGQVLGATISSKKPFRTELLPSIKFASYYDDASASS